MKPKLSVQERKRLLTLIISRKKSISETARLSGISRKTLYKWLGRYKDLVAFSNLKRLSQPDENLEDAVMPRKGTISISPRYSITKKISAINDLLRHKKSATEICRELNISKNIFYRWLRRYRQGGKKTTTTTTQATQAVPIDQAVSQKELEATLETREIFDEHQALAALENKKPKYTRYPGQVTEEFEELILNAVREYPELGAHKLVQVLPVIGNRPVVGDHGVQNVLARYNLNTYESRLEYAKVKSRTPFIFKFSYKTVLSFLGSLWRLPIRTRSKRIAFVTSFSIPFFLSLSLKGIYGYLMIFVTAPSLMVSVGYIFASLSLLFGFLFFLYSFKYYISVALVLAFSRNTLKKQGEEILAKNEQQLRSGLVPDISGVILERQPFVSIHLPLYNEKRVVNRLLEAVTTLDYDNYEVIVCDDSTDETKDIVLEWKNHPRIKISHRETRAGFKGGALREALKLMDPQTEFVLVFDADFLPFSDCVVQFLKYFQIAAGSLKPEKYRHSPVAVVQGYQWHVLNKSENWITRGVRTEYAGSYIIERSSAEIYGGLKQIAGSVYAIRADVLKKIGWRDSITEDFELTLRLYAEGYKVVYTPYIQTPSECVSTIKRLVRQRMRWAEGHSHNIKRMFAQIMSSKMTTPAEKFEFIYLSPYYLQSFFFLLGTFSWFFSEAVFQVRLPFWTAVWGWSLVLTNMLSLPMMNLVGMFLEEAEERDYLGIFSFVALTFIVAPFQAYAAVKGFLEKEEGPWFRTPKTGRITDVFRRGSFYRWLTGLFPGRSPSPAPSGLSQSLIPNQGLALRETPRRQKVSRKRLGNVVVAFTLLFSLGVNYLSYLVPIAKAVSDPQIRMVEGNRKAESNSHRSPETQLQPALLTQPTIFTSPTELGTIETIFHPDRRVRTKYLGRELETVVVGSNGLGSIDQNAKPYVLGKQVVYPEMFAGVDVVYNASGGNTSENFILKERKPLESISSIVRFMGLTPKQESGSIKFLDDQTQEVVYTLSPAYMYEDNLKSQISNLKTNLSQLQNSSIKYSLGLAYEMHKTPIGWQITKYLTEEGKKWLEDPERKFPVVIDPSVVVSGGIVDAETQFGSNQRKVAYVNGNWYAFHNDGADVLYKKSSDGVTWGSNVDVDTTDVDNYNPSIWVKSNVIWVAWIDDSGETIEFNSINTASSDALGSKCTGSSLGTIGSTFTVSIAVEASGTDIYVATTDTSTDTEAKVYSVTSACSFTDITTNSGLTASDMPVLAIDGDGSKQDDLIMVFQDGQLSYSHYSDTNASWVGSNTTIASVTDSAYSVTSDNKSQWILSQSGTTATNFYRIGAPYTNAIETDAGTNRSMMGIDCPTSGDCKIVYFDWSNSSTTGIINFVDCNNTSCSSPTITSLASAFYFVLNDISVSITCPTATDCKVVYPNQQTEQLVFVDCDNAACSSKTTSNISGDSGNIIPNYSSIDCPAATDCKVVTQTSSGNIITFRDCNDAACSSSTGTQIDATAGVTTGYSSIDCPAATDCKVVFIDTVTTNLLRFYDCNTASCSTKISTSIDTDVGSVADPVYVDIDCTAGVTECRVVYNDNTDGDITFVDCNGSTACASANLYDIDTDVGTTGSPVDISCNNNGGSPDDCKVVYFDGTDGDITFVDCNDSSNCSTSTISDLDTEVGTNNAFVAMDCDLGVADCQVVYLDNVDDDITLIDCEDGDCNTPTSTTDIDTSIISESAYVSIDCPAVDDCKIVYNDVVERDVTFVDCADVLCSSFTATDIDTEVGRKTSQSSIYCVAATDCKVIFNDFTGEIWRFIDCNNAACSTDARSTVGSAHAVSSSIDCPVSTDCKLIWALNQGSGGNQNVMVQDCNNTSCSSRTSATLSSAAGSLNTVDIDCSSGVTDCKAVYYDDIANDITFVDCDATDCATNSQLDLDTSVGTSVGGISIDCVGGAADCRIVYYDAAEKDITYIDCANATGCCAAADCAGSGESNDIDTNVGTLSPFIGLSMDCVSATNCKITYYDSGADTLYFVDCNDTTNCVTNEINPIATTIGQYTGAFVAMDCGSDDTDCKIVYADNDDDDIIFQDCMSATCMYATLTAPWTGQTNLAGASISLDTTNSVLYASTTHDSSEQAYFTSTDKNTISWATEASYSFTAGDLSQVSAPFSGAGSTQIAVVLRQGSNFEFAATPENWWTLLFSGMVIVYWIKKKRVYNI